MSKGSYGERGGCPRYRNLGFAGNPTLSSSFMWTIPTKMYLVEWFKYELQLPK
jgi:hypothetical protein